MNEKKIAFIICVNNDSEYAECQYYLDYLSVPEGISASEGDSGHSGHRVSGRRTWRSAEDVEGI